MNHFDTLTIDTLLLRFPSIAQDIFKELDNKSLIKCRKLSVPVQNFIDNEKFIWIRRMQKYNGNMEEFFEQWKRAIKNSPVDNVKELSKAAFQFFEGDALIGKRQYAPLHITASKGLLELSKFIIQKTGGKILPKAMQPSGITLKFVDTLLNYLMTKILLIRMV